MLKGGLDLDSRMDRLHKCQTAMLSLDIVEKEGRILTRTLTSKYTFCYDSIDLFVINQVCCDIMFRKSVIDIFWAHDRLLESS